MDRVGSDQSPGRISAWEALIALVGSVVILVAVIALAGPVSFPQMMGRHPWLDEVTTLTLAGDPSTRHALSALGRGVDLAPPGHVMLLRGISALSGISMKAPLPRWVALIAIAVGVAAVYVTLRTGMGRLPSTVGALAVLGHPVLLTAATDGRVYGCLLGAIAVVVALLRLAAPDGELAGSRPTWRAGVNVCAAFMCAALCTLHYLGVL